MSSVIVSCVFSPFYRVLLAYVYLCISWPFGPIAIQGPFVTYLSSKILCSEEGAISSLI